MSPSLAARTLLLMPDLHQTPLGERDSSSLKRIVHSPYGWSDPGLGAESRTGFNGQLREPPGWYQLGHGHRVYNPRLRRFHSPDRLSPFDEGGLNPYTYCLADPVNFTDPTGRFAVVGEFLKGVFYDKPVVGLALNISLFVVNLGGAIFVPPAGIAPKAALSGTIGALIGSLGSGLQVGGLQDAGAPISFVGALFATAAASTRAVIGTRNLMKKWPEVRKDIGARFMNLLVGGYKAPASTTRALTPPATPNLSRLSATSSPEYFSALGSSSPGLGTPVSRSSSPGSFASAGQYSSVSSRSAGFSVSLERVRNTSPNQSPTMEGMRARWTQLHRF